jgi:phage-related protein
MVWEILLFESKRGDKYVEDFVQTLQPGTIGKFIRSIDLLENYGPKLGMPHSKKLNSDLYELRIRGKEEVRVIYAFKGRKIFLLHTFKKKKQKTPVKELKTAQDRLATLT